MVLFVAAPLSPLILKGAAWSAKNIKKNRLPPRPGRSGLSGPGRVKPRPANPAARPFRGCPPTGGPGPKIRLPARLLGGRFPCHMFLILLRICPMLPVMAHDVLLRPRLVAEMLAVSKSTVYRWFWEGRLQGVKLQAGTIRISASSVQEMLARAADSA